MDKEARELLDSGKQFLIVDDRENDKIKHMLYMALGNARLDPDGQVLVMRLKNGDYILDDWIIEAKEINDLAQSILGKGRSRTVAAQINDMQSSCPEKVNWLVVYNQERDLKPYFSKKGSKGWRNSKGGKKNAAIQIARMKETIRTFKRGYCTRFPDIRYFQLETMQDFVDWLVESYKQKVILGHRK